MKVARLSGRAGSSCGCSLLALSLIFALVSAFGPGVPALSGQIAKHTVSAAATRDQISIDLPVLGTRQHWAVAIRPQSGSQKFTVSPETVFSADPSLMLHLHNESIQPILSGYQIADSTFQLAASASSGMSVLLDVHVPLGKSVSISYGDKAVFAGSISGPLLIVDGQIAPKSSHPVLRGGVLLMGPAAIVDEFGPDLRTDSPGPVPQASTAGLRRHLLSLPPITSSLAGQPFALAGGRAALVAVRIHIDKTGNVTYARIERGDDPLATAARQALQGAKFKPFVQNGKPIAVNGIVSYTLSDGGNLLDVSIK